MNKLNVIDITTGNSVEELELDNKWEKYFSYKNPEFVLHEYITAYLANQRQGTHSTKTRAEVRGGGRKPWAQKHTGRARQGSIRSPLWRKGGIVFGPKPRDYEIKFPKKKKLLVKYLSLADKIKNNNLIVIRELKVESHKTKNFAMLLKNLNLDSQKVLIIDKNIDDKVKLAARNLQNVDLCRINDINAYIVLKNNKLLITKEAFLCL
jgi:large subunit ribosomal protein L4